MKKIYLKLSVFIIAITTVLSCASSENTPSKTAPTLTTSTISNITLNSASSGGNVTSDGGDAVITRGIVWNTATSPKTSLTTKTTDGTGTGNFSSAITSLIPSSTYFIRAYATNSVGTAYGNELSFTTGAIVLPTVSTTAITNITTNSAVSGGNITADGGGTITARGIVWSTSQNPTIALTTKTSDGTGLGSFASNMVTLNQNTTYYVKAYTTNSAGTAYGNQVEFKTNVTPMTVTDIDGNIYNTVTICNQTWLQTNLNVSKYRDGTVIPKVNAGQEWADLTTGAWCYAVNSANIADPVYGKLYNWYAVNDPRGLAPAGYHIPTTAEWTALTDCLGGSSIAGGKMKESGTTHWNGPNTGATNSSGFTGLPSGGRGLYWNTVTGTDAPFWSSSLINPILANYFSLDNSSIDVFSVLPNTFIPTYNDLNNGYSVRCIKN